jgi:hypothetical protein
MFDSDAEKLLVFEAKLISDYDDDADRSFAVNYYLTNKTVAIFEKKNPRKGIAGGRFLARTNVKDPVSKSVYEDGDFYVGAQLPAAGRIFELVDAPEFTLAQLEANAKRFPVGDLQNAVDALRNQIGVAAVTAAFEKKDPSKSGKVSAADGKAVLFGFVPGIVKHTALTLARRFTDGASFDYAELVGYL